MGRHKQVADAEILERARALFVQRGHSVPTREIAKAVGVSQGVLYQRFGSKEQLFLAAVMPSSPDETKILGEEDARIDDVPAYLVTAGTRLLAYLEEVIPPVLELMMHPSFRKGALPHGPGHAHGGLSGVLGRRLARLQERGQIGAVDPQAAADTYFYALHNIALTEALSGTTRTDRSQTVERFVEVIWRGMAPPAPKPPAAAETDGGTVPE